MHNNHITLSTSKKIFIFTLILLFTFYDLIIQIFPGIIAHNVMSDLNISAGLYGTLSGIYFYTYLLMQIPAGLLLDRYPLRNVIVPAMLITAVATFIFSSMSNIWVGYAARLMMGLGTAFAFISVSRTSVDLFDKKYFSMLIGISYFVAASGALFTEIPFETLVRWYGWRHTLYLLAFMGLGLGIILFLFIKYPHVKKSSDTTELNETKILKNLKDITTQPKLWAIALLSFCTWAPITVFASLWGVPYLIDVYHFSASTAGFIISFIWIGLAIASPLLGVLCHIVKSTYILIIGANIVGITCFFLFLYQPNLSQTSLSVIALIIGFTGAAQPLTFSVMREHAAPHYVATALAFNNMASICTGAFLQPITGALIDITWSGSKKVSGEPLYSLENYQMGLIIIPILLSISLIVTFCLAKKQKQKKHLLVSS